jgi:hypothetical protein
MLYGSGNYLANPQREQHQGESADAQSDSIFCENATHPGNDHFREGKALRFHDSVHQPLVKTVPGAGWRFRTHLSFRRFQIRGDSFDLAKIRLALLTAVEMLAQSPGFLPAKSIGGQQCELFMFVTAGSHNHFL